MRQGVSEFQGARLTQAREGRGMTQTMLATLIGRSSTAISRWEKGDQFPEQEALESLSNKLTMPISWFLKPLPEYGNQPYFFRSRAATTRWARAIAKTRLELTHETCLALQEYVDLPSVNVPCLGSTDYLKIRDDDIERLATELRKHWNMGLGPISDLSLALENAGIVISREPLENPSMDGVSKWFDADQRPCIFLNNDKHNYFRQRFDLAHELGHLILHRHLTEIEFNSRYAEIEHQANFFASAFLLPAETFSMEIGAPSLSNYLALKSRWKTSSAAMISRSKHLGIISEEYATRLWKNYSARGWRKGEPGDDQTELEQLRLLSRAVRLLIDEGGFAVGQLISEIGLFEADLETLADLPQGFLSRRDAKVLSLKLKSNNAESIKKSTTEKMATIVSLHGHRKSD